MTCDRCGKETSVWQTSFFNTEDICETCQDQETEHPDFDYAVEVENMAVVAGNHNYQGVGWPGPTGRLDRRRTPPIEPPVKANWYLLQDRLPPREGWYLAFIPEFTTVAPCHCLKWEGDVWLAPLHGTQYGVTHWTFMPEGPEGFEDPDAR